MTDKQLDLLTEKFLLWELPVDFRPDNGIHFTPPKIMNHDWPTGTNLLDYYQARDLLEYLLEDYEK